MYKENYENFEIECHFNEETKCFSAVSIVGNSFCEFNDKLSNFCHGFATPKDAVNDVKSKIDIFLKQAPKSYEELAQMITDSFVWTGYEDCYVDAHILELLVKQFIKTQKQ